MMKRGFLKKRFQAEASADAKAKAQMIQKLEDLRLEESRKNQYTTTVISPPFSQDSGLAAQTYTLCLLTARAHSRIRTLQSQADPFPATLPQTPSAASFYAPLLPLSEALSSPIEESAKMAVDTPDGGPSISQPNTVCVQPSPGKGQGLFLTSLYAGMTGTDAGTRGDSFILSPPQDLSYDSDSFSPGSVGAGALILAEGPLLVLPYSALFGEPTPHFNTNPGVAIVEIPEDAGEEERLEMLRKADQEKRQQEDWAGCVKASLPSLSRADHDKIAALANVFGERSSTELDLEHLEGIAKTNGFKFTLDGSVGRSTPKDEILLGVCNLLSRLNHSCSPNTNICFDASTFSFQLRATRTITPGTELTIAYTNPIQPRDARQAALFSTYRFHCDCVRCTPSPSDSSNPNPQITESDTNLPTITSLTSLNIFTLFSPSSSATSTFTPRILRLIPQVVEILEKEGLEGTWEYQKSVEMMMMVSGMQGDGPGAVNVGERVGRWWISCTTGSAGSLGLCPDAGSGRRKGRLSMAVSGGEVKKGEEVLRRWRNVEEHWKLPWWELGVKGSQGSHSAPGMWGMMSPPGFAAGGMGDVSGGYKRQRMDAPLEEGRNTELECN